MSVQVWQFVMLTKKLQGWQVPPTISRNYPMGLLQMQFPEERMKPESQRRQVGESVWQLRQ